MAVTINTVNGEITSNQLGITLMHEHLAEINSSMAFSYSDWFEADVFVEKIKPVFRRAKELGLKTFVDVTAVNMGRNIYLIKRIADECDIQIIAATGLFFYEDAYLIDKPYEEMAEFFIRDIEEGCQGSNIRAGIIKCATDRFGITPINVVQLKSAALTAVKTGKPITTHTISKDKMGLEQASIFEKQGVDLSKVIIGHVGDTNDIKYLEELLNRGVYIGLDRFGSEFLWPEEDRINNLLELCDRGWIDRITISHDMPYYYDWGLLNFKNFKKQGSFEQDVLFTHIFENLIPVLKTRGMSDDEIHTLLVKNPVRVFNGNYKYD